MTKKGKGARSRNDDRANSKNPEHPANKASLDNHSRQLNKKDPKYSGKKGK